MKKNIFLIGITLFLFISCSKETSKNNSEQSVLDKDEIIVGMELQFPPFETIDKNGNPYGISIDIANALSEFLGKKVKIEEFAYSGLIPALTSKKIDMIISSMTITDERKEQIDFSNPYASAYLSLLIYKDSPVQNPNDLNKENVKIAVKKGTTSQIMAEELYTNAQILVFDKDAEAVFEVSQGKADVFIYDVYTIYKNHLEYPNTTRVYLLPISDKDHGDWGIAIRKNEKYLKEKLNEFLIYYDENGIKDKIINNHLSEVKAYFDTLNIPFFIN